MSYSLTVNTAPSKPLKENRVLNCANLQDSVGTLQRSKLLSLRSVTQRLIAVTCIKTLSVDH